MNKTYIKPESELISEVAARPILNASSIKLNNDGPVSDSQDIGFVKEEKPEWSSESWSDK